MKSLALVCAMAMVALATACGSDDASGGGGGGDKVKVLVLLPTLEDESYIREQAGAKAAAKKYPNADISFAAGSGRTDATDLISKVETAVTQGVDVIAVNAGGAAKQLRPAVQAAVGQDVKVVAFDQPVPGAKGVSSSVLFDNRKADLAAGEWMNERLPNGGEIGVVRCLIGNPVMDAREQGFKDGLKQANAKVRVVGRGDAQCLPEKARSLVEDMLSAHPKLKGIYSDTDVAIIGGLEALKAAKKDPVVIGHDGQKAAIKRIANGNIIDASVRLSYEDVGALAVKTAVRVAEDKKVPSVVDVPQYPLITKENAAKLLDQVNANEGR